MHSVKGVADSDEPTESYHQCQTLQLPLTLHSIFTVFELIALLLWHITILAHVLGSHHLFSCSTGHFARTTKRRTPLACEYSQ